MKVNIQELVEQVNSYADKDGVITGLSMKNEALRDRLIRLTGSKENMVEWVKTHCNKLILVRGYNEGERYYYVAKNRGYITMDVQGQEVFNKVEVMRKLGTMDDNGVALNEFLQFHANFESYARINGKLTLKEYCKQKFNVNYTGQKERFGGKQENWINYIAKFADEKGCVDAIKLSENISNYQIITKALNTDYKPNNYTPQIPILQQFVNNETHFHFTSNLIEKDVVSYVGEQLWQRYPEGVVTKLYSKYPKLYNQAYYIGDVLFPGEDMQFTLKTLYDLKYEGRQSKGRQPRKEAQGLRDSKGKERLKAVRSKAYTSTSQNSRGGVYRERYD